MASSSDVTIGMLDAQCAELLPQRETMLFDVNVAPVIGVNVSLAINAATIGSVANSGAWQNLASVHY